VGQLVLIAVDITLTDPKQGYVNGRGVVVGEEDTVAVAVLLADVAATASALANNNAAYGLYMKH
jgi:hypothetical protein